MVMLPYRTPWDYETKPFKIVDGVYYVGNKNVSVHLFDTGDGLLLLDTAYTETAYLLFDSIYRLGFNPRDVRWIVHSHGHYDHFDPDSVPVMLSGTKTALIAAKDVQVECERLGLNGDITYLACGETAEHGELRVTGVPCDHGELAPDALGLLIEVEGKTIYYMGDTAYRPDYLENPALKNVDLLLLPINGAFGNLNEEQAAKVIDALAPKLAVPCHYWNFAEHGGNPGVFKDQMEKIAPTRSYLLMRQGEGILI